jgi:hypothetical protein
MTSGHAWRFVLTTLLMLSLDGPTTAQDQVATPQGNVETSQVQVGTPEVGTPEDLGATYYFLEGKARRTITRFVSGSATTERLPDGRLKTRVYDRVGNELTQVDVDHSTIEREGQAVRLRQDVRPTLEWANVQGYALWLDRGAETFKWQGRLLRGKTANVEDQVGEVQAEFEDAVVVKSAKSTTFRNQAGKRPTFVTQISHNGQAVGTMYWYAAEQILAWRFPGLTEGMIDPRRIGKPWQFKPTLAWATVQGLAFYQFHTLVKTNGKVAQFLPKKGRSWLTELLMPTVHANEPGCDGFHWADGSVYRPCCDSHDRCYYKSGCNAYSWFWWSYWGNTWSCHSCNAAAVGCFITTFVDVVIWAS